MDKTKATQWWAQFPHRGKPAGSNVRENWLLVFKCKGKWSFVWSHATDILVHLLSPHDRLVAKIWRGKKSYINVSLSAVIFHCASVPFDLHEGL